MREKLLGMYKSFDDGVNHPRLDVEFEFDFHSTDPRVYSIFVERRLYHFGYWAVAKFRKSNAGLARVVVHSPHGPEEALEKLITHLKSTYMRKE